MSDPELDRIYDNARAVGNRDEIVARWLAAGERAERELAPATHRYGPHPAETLTFAAAGPDAPCVVWIHGGWWRGLSARHNAFAGIGLRAHGVSFANVDYPLAPEAPLEAIVASARRALAHVVERSAELGIDARRIVVAGHSAGGHLAAMCAVTIPVAGVMSVSGLHDLRALEATFIQETLALDAQRYAALSPALLRPAGSPPVAIAVGERELDGFHVQARLLADAWRASASRLTETTTPGDDHFTIVDRLADPADPLTALLAQMADRPAR